MTTDESIMAEMLDRATKPDKDRVDELGVQMFCLVVRSNSQLVHKAQEMIRTKICSSNVIEATRAIALLEECMTQCGGEFQEEAAKFRFLNGLIRLVSKKYEGAETAHEVKQRIMECLLLWTTEFPDRQKIRDAYDMLRKEGDIEHGQSAAAQAKRETVLNTIDEAMFAKLIRSKDPENFKRANLLLQYRMAQEARRNDLLAQHRLVLQEVQETMKLLNQMLDTYNPNDPSEDVSETIHELYKSCKKHKPIFHHLPELLGESDAQLIEDTLQTNGELIAIMSRYKQLVASPGKAVGTPGTTPAGQGAGAGLASNSTASGNASLLNELLGDLLLNDSNGTTINNPKTNVMSDLSDIFSSALAESEQKQQIGHVTKLLEPQVLSPSKTDNGNDPSNGAVEPMGDTKTYSASARKMPAIAMLSEELFQRIMPTQERVSSFKREPEKLTLNDLARERMHVKPATEQVDDVPLLSAPDIPTKVEQSAPAPIVMTSMPSKQHLSEINIELDHVQATGEQRVVLDDDDLHLSLNFTEDRPSQQVSVIVISAQNKSRLQLKDFQFEASVRKPCKVRLMAPTDNEMLAHKPFRPVTPINQVMLLLNPTGKPVDITCIVSYKLGDDPDPIKESIVAQGIAYVD
ncbi:ADP-ribosylation factor-binding protein GGA1 isoform X1 [Drosophila busckii]|uniref:ADP-ribosylation factor-binding protein GGA1 isoform X1 n=1 Tax=Drosophila busckii TaxID=30019 RepID=UPI001432E39C|nr:ADP-ribosylation factor-binding protein GGA1 isoform X1 [Drosophila busckii]